MNEDKKKLLIVGLAVVALVAAVGSGVMTIGRASSFPGEAEAQERSLTLAKLANKCRGDYDALTPEEQKQTDDLTNGNGRNMMRQLHMGP